MKAAGSLDERIGVDAPTETTDAFGGVQTAWVEQFQRAAEFIYQSGNETVQAARLAGRSIYKIRLRSDSGTRAITTDWRIRDTRRATTYNVREVDAIADRAWVYLTVEADGS